ncbi:MAG: hypothetical protein ABI282_10350 [Candidatus Baltobacteraceae bacterium]
MGHHHVHPYALQALCFGITLIVPGVVFALLGGAWLEQKRRSGSRSREAVAVWHGRALVTQTESLG